MTYCNARRPYGRVRPSVVLVVALVVGLVATALLWNRDGEQTREGTEPAVDGSDSSAPDAPSPLDALVTAPAPAAPTAEAARPPSKAKLRFTVAVAPLILVTTDRAAALASESIYMALVDELRAVPNLDLVETDSTDRQFAP